jgi:subtilisin-like proprotein convertase family protein
MKLFTEIDLIRGFQVKTFLITLFVTLFAASFSYNSNAQTATASWPLTTDAVAINTGNVTGGSLSSSNVNTESFGSDGISTSGWETSASLNNTKYYQLSITPTAGYDLNINAISLYQNTDGASGTAQLQYDFDPSFTTPVTIGSSFSIATSGSAFIDFTALSIAVTNGQTLYIRVFGWELEDADKVFNLKDFSISGTTTCVAPDINNFNIPSLSPLCYGSDANVLFQSSSLSTDTYIVTYNLSGANTAIGLTANAVFTSGTPGSATFTISGANLANAGNTTLTITSIENSLGCSSTLTTDNTASITITALPVATFSYNASPYCQNAANPSPTFSGGGVAGTFSSTPGLVFVSTATGQINLSASTPGTYTVTNTIAAAGGCAQVTATSDITITALPSAAFTYGATPFCQNGTNPTPTFIGSGVAGTFSSSAGLAFISTATGQINLSASTAGTYTVTNSIAASGGCAIVTANASVTVRATPTATISPASTNVCKDGTSPTITFSNPQNLPVTVTYNINGGSSATINIAASSTTSLAAPTGTDGVFNYNLQSVAYQSAPGCDNSISGTSVITVRPTPTVNVSGTTTVCQGDVQPVVTFDNPQNFQIVVTYKINGGADQLTLIDPLSSVTFNVSTASAGTTTYTIVSARYLASPLCTNTSIPGTAVVTVRATPTATISGTTAVCTGATSPNVTFTNPQALPVTVTYNINGGSNQTINIAASSTATVAAPTGTAGAFNYNLVNVFYQSGGGCTNTISGTATITVNATPSAATGPVNGSRCGTGTVNLSVAAPGAGLTVDWYATASGGTALASGSTSFTTPSISVTTTYYAEVRNTTSGCVSTTRTAVVATVNTVPAAATGATGASRCGTGSVTISVAAPGAGLTVDWYAAASGGSALVSGSTSYTTPSIATTTTYYAEVRNTTTGCVAASRTAVVATINPLPANASGATGASRCGTGSVTISVAAPGAGLTVDWYAAASGGSALVSGSTSYTTPSISSTTTYYAEVRNTTTGCVSSGRTAVTATINTIPSAATGPVNGSRCGTGTVNLSVAAPGAGLTVDWYAAASGGTALASGSTSFTTPSISVTTTYYAEVRNTTSGCVSTTRTAVVATVNTVPAAATGATGASRCGTGSVTISVAAPGAGLTVDWYAAASGGSALVSGSTSYTTPSIATTTTYYAEVRTTATGCVAGTRTAVTATVNALPVISSVTASPTSVCPGGSSNLVVTAPAVSPTTLVNYNFNSGANYGALVSNAAAGISSSVTSTVTFGTAAGTASGGLAFATNATAGNGLSSGTTNATWTFTLTGSAISDFSSFAVYYQAARSSANTTVTLSYSVDGGAFTSTGITASNGTNPITLTSGIFQQVLLNMPSGADNPTTSIAFRITATNFGSAVLTFDNFQVQGVKQDLYSWTASPSGASAGLPANAGTALAANNDITVSPTVTTTYTVTATNADGCTTTAPVTINTFTEPVITSVTATPTAICSGGSSNLVVTAPAVSPTTLVNYNFNAGSSFATLTPTLASGITSTVSGGTATFGTATGVATGGSAFATNTAGNALTSIPNRTWIFNLGGTELSTYSTFRIYYQVSRNSGGDNTVTAAYSLNGAAYTSTGISASVGANPINMTGTGTWYQVLLDLPSAVDNPSTSLAIRLTIGNSGSGNVQLDNFQVQGVKQDLYSWTASPSGASAGLPANAGTALAANNDITVSPTVTTAYTVTATNANGCTQTASAVTVTLNPTPTLSSSLTASRCSNVSATYTATSAVGGTTFTWTRATVAGISNGAGSGSGAAITETLINTTAAPVNVVYAITLTANGCSNTQNVTITVNPTPTLSSSLTASRCSNVSTTYTATSATSGTTFTWSRAVVAGISNAAGSGSGAAITETLINTTSSPVNVVYAITLTANGCSNTQNVIVTVNPIPTVSATPSTQTICTGTVITTISVSNPNGVSGTTFSWTRDNTSNITGTSSGSGSSITVTLTNTTTTVQTTTFTITATANSCSSVTTVTVAVNPSLTASISGTTTVCQDATAPNITFTNPRALPVTITYNINGGTNQTVDVNASSSATVAAPTGVAGTFNYNLVSVQYQSGPNCPTTISGSATVTVRPTPTATISGTTTVCRNGTSPNITFTNPQALPITITYNINGGSNQTINVPASGSNTVAAPTTVAGVFNYNLVSVVYQTAPTCANSISGTATVTVNPTPAPTITGTTTVCQNATSPDITFTNPQALDVSITYNINGGSNQTINVNGNSSATVAAPTGTAGVFTYNLVSVAYQSAPACVTSITGSAIITVRPTPTATISGTTAVCLNGTTPNITFTNPQAIAVTITYTINGGSNQTINVSANSSATVAAPTGTAGNFVYDLVSVAYQSAPNCPNTISGTATVTVHPLPVVSTSAASVCVNSTITALPNSGGTWISSNNSIATITNAGLITGVAAGNVTFTYTLTATGCSNTTVPVTVNPLPFVAPITDGVPALCVNDITVFTNATAGGTWSVVNGTGAATIDAGGLVTGVAPGSVTIVYTYFNGICTNSVSKALTINAIPVVGPIGGGAATVCVNASTPAFTNTTPGGTWSIINGTGTATVNAGGVVTGLTAGTVTVIYTVDNGTCSDDAAIGLTINALPVVAPIGGGAAAVCVNSSTPTFTNATAGGTWSIVNGTGTASITPGGIVTGLTAGTVTVVYTYSNGICTNTATQALTVNALPVIAPIGGGAATVCVNSATAAFTNATAGGVWSILNGTGTASITPGGIVTGLTPGTVTVVYTVTTGASCTDNVTTPLTVNTLPIAGAITGANTVCAGSTISLNHNASGAGGLSFTWLSSNPAFATVTNAGVVTGVAAGNPGITYTVTDGNGCSATSPAFGITVYNRPSATITSNNTTLCNGGNTTITGTITATGNWLVILSDGSNATGNGNGSFNITVSPSATATYTITTLTDDNCSANPGDLNGSTTVTVNQPVSINTHPATTQTACTGNSVSFTVGATGTGLTYQWFKGATPLSNGGNITGANAATLIINPVTLGDAATDYHVVVSGAAPCTPATSNNAALVVNQAVAISTHPASQTTCTGDDVSFTVAATGTGLTYQWRKNGSPLTDGGSISGATTNTLTLTGIAAADAGNYTVTVTGVAPCTPVTSTTAVLTVNNAVVINTQPDDAAVCATFPVTFTVNAAGTGLSYQWYKGNFPGTPLTNNANISGVNTASLHFNQANVPDVDNYYVIVSGLSPCAPVRSDYAHLSVDQTITIHTQPVSQTACAGSDATFHVSASAGGQDLLFQWRKGLVDIPGATDSTFTITGVTAADAGAYNVVVTGLAGCITSFSNNATLTVDAQSDGGTVNSSTAVCDGANSGTLTLTGKNGNVLRWEFSTDGGTGWSPIANTGLTQGYSNLTVETMYRAVVKNGVCVADESTPAVITIKPIPDAVATPASQTICSGNNITLIELTGAVSGTVFNWTRNNTGTVTGIAASGSGDISGALTNTTAAPITVTFTITPVANGCTGTPITATVVVNPGPGATATPASQTICSGENISTIALSGATSGSVFNWTRNNNGSVTGIAASGSGDINGALTNTTTAPVTVTFTIAADANGCTGAPITATIVVNPTPDAVATPASQTICSGSSITTIGFSGAVSGTTFNWTRNNTGTVTGIANSGSGNISGVLTNTTASPITVTFTITPVANGCSGTPVIATVLVNPSPVTIATPNTQNICSGSSITNIELSSATSGTTYNWTRNNTGTVTGIAASGSGDITGALTNSTSAPITVTFTITPSANGCTGAISTAAVTVNPIPNAISTPANQIVCSDVAITDIILSGSVAGTSFNWTRNNTGTVTGIAASGSGDITGILSNTTASPVTVTFTIIPTANGCDGSAITATVTVNPSANLGVSATPATQTICSGNPITAIDLTSSTPGTTYTWTRNNTGTATGIAASGTGNTISGSFTNTTASPVTVAFTITPSANGCPGIPITAEVVVNPGPNAVATPASQIVCSGAPITTIALTGNTAGTTYNWTRNNTGTVTGIAASGSGDISGTLVNTTSAAITVTFTVTPTYSGCTGAAITATVLVRPTPTVNATNASQTLCSGVAMSNIVVTNPNAVTGTTLSWSRDNGTLASGNLTGIAASGSSASFPVTISGTLTNTTTTQQTTTFTFTVTANGCSSSTTVVRTVNPRPVLTNPSTASICNNSTVNIPLTSNIPATYTWIAANNTIITGESLTLQNSSVINNTLNNPSAPPGSQTSASPFNRQNVTYTVTATTPEGCQGTQSVVVTVNPPVNISFNQVADENLNTICDGQEVGGGGQNDLDIWTGNFTGASLQWQYSFDGTTWDIAPGTNGGIQYVLPTPPSIFSPIGSYYFRLLIDNCPSDIATMQKVSTLTINAGPDLTTCQKAVPTAVTLSGASVGGTSSTTRGGTWSITSLNPDNGAAIGTLSSTAFRNMTPTNTVQTVTYTPPANYTGEVTLTLTSNDPDGSGLCLPLVATRKIIVTQAPIISNELALPICSGTSTNINLTSVIPSTYTWTVGTITGGVTGASAGSGNLIDQILTNPSSVSAGTVQYVVTPTPIDPAVCAAITSTITVTVNPAPTVSLAASPLTICQGSTSTLTATNTGGATTLTYSGTSGTLNQTIPNNSNSAYSYPSITLAGSGGATVTTSDVIQVTLNITHPFTPDLDVFLVDPSGTRAMLLFADIGSGANFTNTILRTDVANIIGTAGNNTNPFTNTYRPVGTIATAPVRTGAAGGATYNAVVPANALSSSGGAPIDGTWTLRVFDDATGNTGTISNWSLSIIKTVGYTTVFNGPASIGAVTYPTSSTATASVTPPAGIHAYTATTTDALGCFRTSTPVSVTVNPAPTLSGVAQQATVCSGSTAQVNLTGLVAGSTSTITYTINGGAPQNVTGVVANGSGDASFNTIALTAANNGQALQVTGITITSATPNCTAPFTQSLNLAVNPTPTLTGAVQAAAVCPGSNAQINLSGLVPNSTANITYTINGGAPQTATGITATAGGTASFTTPALSFANNGQVLQVTGITITSATPNCSQSFTQNVTLAVNPIPVLSSTLTPLTVCGGTTFSYTPTSATGGASFTWTRAAVSGITPTTSSGSGNISEVLTNNTAAPITVTYVVITSANGCNNAPGENVTVTINPQPTLATVTMAGTACSGSGGTVNLTGLVPGATTTVFYTINGVAQTPVTGVVANGSGNASFTTAALTAANNGQLLRVTGLTITSSTPNCTRSFNILAVLSVNTQPTLTGATQAATVCISGQATINLTGLVANSTNNTINYSINGVAQTPVSGINADASGHASFNTSNLTPANNGQLLTVTGITNGTCTQAFTQNVTLAVSASNIWLGVNTNWFDPINWCGGVPTLTSDVIIPGSLSFYPLLNTGIGTVHDINIQNTATVTVSGAKLQIAGAINNSGSFNAIAGTIEMKGSSGAQSISGNMFVGNTINSLVISNVAGVNVASGAGANLNIADSLTFGNVNNSTLNTGDNITLLSRAAKTARVGDITNGGNNAGNAISGTVTVERYIPEQRSWRLMNVPIRTAGAPSYNASWQEGVVNPDFVYANRLDPNPGYGTLISGPLSPAFGFDPSPMMNHSVKYYNETTSQWVGIGNTLTGKVTDHEGYMVFVRGDRSTMIYLNTAAPTSNTILRAKGQLRTNLQTITVPAGVGPYTVVGNPYASTIDIRKINTTGSVSSNTYVVWDPSLTGSQGVGAYQYLTQSGGPGSDYVVFPGNSAPGGGSYGPALSVHNTIQSSQAFLVQNAGAGTVNINENAKLTTSSSAVFRPGKPTNNPVGRLSTLLSYENDETGNNTTLVDGALLLYNDGFNDEVDLDDARKLTNFSSENFGVESKGNWLAIERKSGIKETDTIFFKARSYRVRNYQLAITGANISRPGLTGYLEDKYLKTSTPLNLDGTTIYKFKVSVDTPAWDPARFRIVFKTQVMAPLPVTFTNVKGYQQQSNINVEWHVENESNIRSYEVEKSVDGIHFAKANTVTAINNGNRKASYNWIDKNPVNGINYYRIRSKEFSDKEQVTPVVKIQYGNGRGDIAVYPNPLTDGTINLYLVNQVAGKYLVRLVNNLGQVIVAREVKHAGGGTQAVQVQPDRMLPQGNYHLEVTRPDGDKKVIYIMY